MGHDLNGFHIDCIYIGAFFANFLVAYMRNAFWWEMVFVAAGLGCYLAAVSVAALVSGNFAPR